MTQTTEKNDILNTFHFIWDSTLNALDTFLFKEQNTWIKNPGRTV